MKVFQSSSFNIGCFVTHFQSSAYTRPFLEECFFSLFNTDLWTIQILKKKPNSRDEPLYT